MFSQSRYACLNICKNKLDMLGTNISLLHNVLTTMTTDYD